MKKVIAACVYQILQFDSERELERYLDQLRWKKQQFEVIWKKTLDDGKIQIRIKKQYNNNELA